MKECRIAQYFKCTVRKKKENPKDSHNSKSCRIKLFGSWFLVYDLLHSCCIDVFFRALYIFTLIRALEISKGTSISLFHSICHFSLAQNINLLLLYLENTFLKLVSTLRYTFWGISDIGSKGVHIELLSTHGLFKLPILHIVWKIHNQPMIKSERGFQLEYRRTLKSSFRSLGI